MLQMFFVSACMSLLYACGEKKKDEKPKPPPTAVNVYEVKKETAVYYDEFPATVVALNQVELRAQVTGYITGIYFKDGQHVNKGQKLYDIDHQQFQASYDQAIANLNVSKANLAKAQQDADRYGGLLKQDAIAKQVYDHSMADLQSAKMQVEAARSSARNVQATVKYSAIYASFAGTIGISLVKTGALVTANQTLLNTISSENPIAADIALDQKEIPRFVKLQQEKSIAKDSVFTLRLPDNSIYPESGKVSLIDRAVDPQTGTIKVRLVFANTNNFLKAGMNTNVLVKNNNADSLFMVIPYKAVTEQMGEYFVYVVNDSSKAIQHKIILGTRIADKVIVKEGLEEGDNIITDGAQKVKDSTIVQVGAPKKK
ncbi:MAG: efflux RND transporter periplasmic adaptor subunit [Chitinophagaceae bacterium]|nr:efflux RND transporter periplasmic adaptor subunit [Chitinophagaceae bacterium]